MKDICFKCRKCGHQMYYKINKTPENNCNGCGEEPEDNLLFVGYGNLGDRK